MDEEEQNRRRMQLIASYITLPFALAVPPIVGWFIGSWLDKHFNIAPYGMYTLLVLGMVAGVREFYRIVKKNKDKDF